jgi:hypothetical protein
LLIVWVAPSMSCTPPPTTTYTRFSYVFTGIAPAGHMETITKWGLDCGIVRRAMMCPVCHPSNLPPVCNGPSLTRFAPRIPYIYPQNTSKTSGFRTAASATFLLITARAGRAKHHAHPGSPVQGCAPLGQRTACQRHGHAERRWHHPDGGWHSLRQGVLADAPSGPVTAFTARAIDAPHGARHRRTPRGAPAR